MMTLNSESEVMKKLNIDAWDELDPDKFSRYILLSPKIDANLQQEMVKNIPDFADRVMEALDILLQKGLAEDRKISRKNEHTFVLLSNMVSELRPVATNKKLTEDDIRFLIDRTKVIASVLMEIERENYSFWRYYGKWALGLGAISMAAIGTTVAAVILKRPLHKKGKRFGCW